MNELIMALCIIFFIVFSFTIIKILVDIRKEIIKSNNTKLEFYCNYWTPLLPEQKIIWLIKYWYLNHQSNRTILDFWYYRNQNMVKSKS